MNKRMRELLTLIQAKSLEAKSFMEGENKDVEKANALLDEMDALQKEYDVEARLYEAQKNEVPQDPTPVKKETKEVSPLAQFGKDAKIGFKLDKSMNEAVGADGGYTVSEDVVTLIQKYRESKFSLMSLVRVIPVKTKSGQRTFKKRAQQTGFTKVGEGGKVGAKATPQFERVEYAIDKYAGYFPVTNEVLADSDENLGQVLVEWIGDESRVTGNNLILEAINTKVAVDLKNLDGIKKAINVTLGQAFKATALIVTNDDGLNYLDTLKDGNDRYMLTPNPTDPMSLTLTIGATSIPVKVVPNADMPTNENKIPFVIGDLHEGIAYWDRQQLNIKISDVAVVGELNAYEEDLTLYRAIEREDVTTWDVDAFVNGYILGE